MHYNTDGIYLCCFYFMAVNRFSDLLGGRIGCYWSLSADCASLSFMVTLVLLVDGGRYGYHMLIRVMLHQLSWLVYWDNCNNVEHVVSLGILSNTVLSYAVVGDDDTRKTKMLGQEIVSSLYFWFLGNFRLNILVPGVKLWWNCRKTRTWIYNIAKNDCQSIDVVWFDVSFLQIYLLNIQVLLPRFKLCWFCHKRNMSFA